MGPSRHLGPGAPVAPPILTPLHVFHGTVQAGLKNYLSDSIHYHTYFFFLKYGLMREIHIYSLLHHERANQKAFNSIGSFSQAILG